MYPFTCLVNNTYSITVSFPHISNDIFGQSIDSCITGILTYYSLEWQYSCMYVYLLAYLWTVELAEKQAGCMDKFEFDPHDN